MLSRLSTRRRVAALLCAVLVIGAGVAIAVLVEPAPAAIATSPIPTPTAAPSPTTRPTPRPTRRPTPEPSPSPTPTPNIDEENVTILLVGRDFLASRAAHGESGMNTDMLIVANLRADGSRIDLMSLPRDSSDVPLGDGTTWSGKINGLRAVRGLDALDAAMGATLDLPIDYHAEITLDDLARLVDAVGGVTVALPAPLHDPHLKFSWRAGVNHLNGQTAVLFARSRFADSDYARADRNQALLLALRDRLLAGGYDPVALLTALPGLETNVPAAEIPALLDLARKSAGAPVGRKVFAPPEFTEFVGVAGARGYISIPDLDAIRAYVAGVVSD